MRIIWSKYPWQWDLPLCWSADFVVYTTCRHWRVRNQQAVRASLRQHCGELQVLLSTGIQAQPRRQDVWRYGWTIDKAETRPAGLRLASLARKKSAIPVTHPSTHDSISLPPSIPPFTIHSPIYPSTYTSVRPSTYPRPPPPPPPPHTHTHLSILPPIRPQTTCLLLLMFSLIHPTIRNYVSNSILKRGFMPAADVNDCALGVCSHSCYNTPGAFRCACPSGMELTPSGRTCRGESDLKSGESELEYEKTTQLNWRLLVYHTLHGLIEEKLRGGNQRHVEAQSYLE